MRLFGLNRRRSSTLLLAVSQLVLIAYVFQVAAIEHWHSHQDLNVEGVIGSSAHVRLHEQHCHGALASCADASAGFALDTQHEAYRTPEERPSLALAVDWSGATPDDALARLQPQQQALGIVRAAGPAAPEVAAVRALVHVGAPRRPVLGRFR